MKTTRIFTILMVIATIFFMEACKGEKGDIGPSGANGVGTGSGRSVRYDLKIHRASARCLI